MRYGVIVCPNCKKAKGVLLSNKTSRCARCGKILKINKLKIFHETNSTEEMQNAIGLLNAKLDGRAEEFLNNL